MGWVLSGRLGPPSLDMHCLETHILRVTIEPIIHSDLQTLQKFWQVEEVGSSDHGMVSKFEEDIVHNGTRYVVKLPFNPLFTRLQSVFQI